MKKKLLIIAGAGASVELGMPSTSCINELFNQWCQEICCLANNENKSLYQYICETALPKSEDTTDKDSEINFEQGLYILFLLDTLHKDSISESVIKQFVELNKFLDVKCYGEIKKVAGYDLSNLAFKLIDKLLDEFRSRCINVKNSHLNEFNKFKDLMCNLNKEFEVGIITTNYDNLFTQAMPGLFTGFNEKNGEFIPESVYKRTAWDFCYHLHGSVHFDMKATSNSLHEIYWQKDLQYKFAGNSTGRNANQTMEGLFLPTSAIIAGYDKLNQIARSPFLTYFSQLERYVLEADACLFIGYGFADLHINNCFSHIWKTNKKPVVIISSEKDNQDCMQFRNDKWASNLNNCIPFDRNKISFNGEVCPRSIGFLKKVKSCETSSDSNYPISIWYNGLLEACDNYDLLRSKLNL